MGFRVPGIGSSCRIVTSGPLRSKTIEIVCGAAHCVGGLPGRTGLAPRIRGGAERASSCRGRVRTKGRGIGSPCPLICSRRSGSDGRLRRCRFSR